MNKRKICSLIALLVFFGMLASGCATQSTQPKINQMQNEGRDSEDKGLLSQALTQYRSARELDPANTELNADIIRVENKIKAHRYYQASLKYSEEKREDMACLYLKKAVDLWAEHPQAAKLAAQCDQSQQELVASKVPPEMTILPQGKVVTHAVQSGESLSMIITMYYGEYKQYINTIRTFNSLTDATPIYAGQPLKLPTIKRTDGSLAQPDKSAFKMMAEADTAVTGPAVVTPPPALSRPPKTPAAQSQPDCAAILKEARDNFEKTLYVEAGQKFAKAKTCTPNCQECERYLLVIDGILMSKNGQYQMAVERLDQALAMQGSGSALTEAEIRTLRDQTLTQRVGEYKRIFVEAMGSLESERGYKEIIQQFDSGQNKAVLEWLKQPASMSRSGQELARANSIAATCDECRQYEADYKSRLYEMGVGYKSRQDWLKAVITWEKIHFIDPDYKDVGRQLKDDRNVLMALLPIL